MTKQAEANSDISDFLNARASDLARPQPVISRILFALIGAIALVAASWLSSAQFVHPRVTVDFNPELTIDYRFDAQTSIDQCDIVINEFEATLSSICEACKIASGCNVGPNTLLDVQPKHSKNPVLAAVFQGGSALYLTEDSEAALELCNMSAVADGDVTCIRPTDLSQIPSKRAALSDSAIAVAVALLSSLMLIILLSRYRRDHMSPMERAVTGHRQASAVATWVSDLLSIFLAWLAVVDGLNLTAPIPSSSALAIQMSLGAAAVTAWMAVVMRHYARRRAMYDEAWECVYAVIAIGLLHVVFAAFMGTGNLELIALIWATAIITIPVMRFLQRTVLDDMGLWRRPVIVVGNGNNAIAAVNAISQDFTLGYKILAVADPELAQPAGSIVDVSAGPSVISAADLEQLPDKVQIVIALDSVQDEYAQQIIHRLVAANRRVHMIPPLRGLPAMGMQVSHFFSHNTVMLTLRNNLARADYKIIKRLFDIVVSALLLVLLSPLFLYVAARIRLDGSPALFEHERVGKRGKPFQCLKFRSMHVDSQNMLRQLLQNDPKARADWERDFKIKDDPRITNFGKLIRETSIDELPQLVNVLKGDMSLVGPRPVIEEELERYGDYKSFYVGLNPGITGLWQVSGRSDTSYDERVALDVWYAQNWSLVYDIAILFKTIGVVFNKKGAY